MKWQILQAGECKEFAPPSALVLPISCQRNEIHVNMRLSSENSNFHGSALDRQCNSAFCRNKGLFSHFLSLIHMPPRFLFDIHPLMFCCCSSSSYSKQFIILPSSLHFLSQFLRSIPERFPMVLWLAGAAAKTHSKLFFAPQKYRI